MSQPLASVWPQALPRPLPAQPLRAPVVQPKNDIQREQLDEAIDILNQRGRSKGPGSAIRAIQEKSSICRLANSISY